ncbi:amidohydrolase [soil metagenome]
MPQDLNITLIQSDLHWQSIEANLAMFEEKIWQIQAPSDLIILPEMFNTGFNMEVETLSEPMNSKTFRWMKQMAQQTKAVVTGSYIVREGSAFFNRLIWMEPDGNYNFYDKRHLFRMAEEHQKFSAGKKRMVRDLKSWKICPLVCYDLRFPAWARNQVNKATGELDYDLLLFVANWPQGRINAWNILLKARSVENLCFTVGVNRVGEDGKGIAYNGNSQVINPKGEKISDLGIEQKMETVTLNYEELKHLREKFPTFLDADEFEINL